MIKKIKRIKKNNPFNPCNPLFHVPQKSQKGQKLNSWLKKIAVAAHVSAAAILSIFNFPQA